jgi:hypothetical protein
MQYCVSSSSRQAWAVREPSGPCRSRRCGLNPVGVHLAYTQHRIALSVPATNGTTRHEEELITSVTAHAVLRRYLYSTYTVSQLERLVFLYQRSRLQLDPTSCRLGVFAAPG